MRMLLVYITVPDSDTARALGETLVRERLAACANIIEAMESRYWWEGQVQTAHESLCLCKTQEDRYQALEARARELHPYDIPCIVAVPLLYGYAPFMQWIADETRVR